MLILAIALVAAPASAPARSRLPFSSTRVPPGFVGVNASGPLLDPRVDLAHEFDRMVRNGVESVRVVFSWAAAQPYRTWQEVPRAQSSQFTNVGGIPTDFSASDRLVALAASRGLSLLPVVIYAPAWDSAPPFPSAIPAAPDSLVLPLDDRRYGDFLTALIGRYGPRGSFWRDHHPEVALRAWQIWNEPNISYFWPQQPFASSYVSLLRAAHAAIKRADRGAKVVLAGLTNSSWTDLATIYSVHRAQRLFDEVAVHPYTRTPQDVIAILRRVRQVMNRAGDRHKLILISEIGWLSSLGKANNPDQFDFTTTESGQAKDVASLVPMLGANRTRLGLAGFDYFTWAGVERGGARPFDFAGLLRMSSPGSTPLPKPALFAFRRAALALELCLQKGRLATICHRPAQ